VFGTDEDKDTHRIGFLLIPDFSMIGFASAVEPLRLSNRTKTETVYSGYTYSLDGEPVTASNGIPVVVDAPLSEATGLHIMFVCSGIRVRRYLEKPYLTVLRRMATHGTDVGGICTGSYILAKAGLLDDHRCTVHWENLAAFTEDFPDIDVTSELFEIDRNRYTCAGGTAALDMMLTIIGLQEGTRLAAEVADMMLHHRIRDGHEAQRMGLRSRLGIAHPKLLDVIEHMEANLEEPLSCAELAIQVGLSTRQLERLFSKYLNHAPTRYYLDLRLNRARFLLRQTSLPVLSVALAAGFVSASHFSKCYREHFKRTPSEERRQVT